MPIMFSDWLTFQKLSQIVMLLGKLDSYFLGMFINWSYTDVKFLELIKTTISKKKNRTQMEINESFFSYEWIKTVHEWSLDGLWQSGNFSWIRNPRRSPAQDLIFNPMSIWIKEKTNIFEPYLCLNDPFQSCHFF